VKEMPPSLQREHGSDRCDLPSQEGYCIILYNVSVHMCIHIHKYIHIYNSALFFFILCFWHEVLLCCLGCCQTPGLKWSSHLNCLHAGIAGVCHHTWLFFLNDYTYHLNRCRKSLW
jgi:hypothetical protein